MGLVIVSVLVFLLGCRLVWIDNDVFGVFGVNVCGFICFVDMIVCDKGNVLNGVVLISVCVVSLVLVLVVLICNVFSELDSCVDIVVFCFCLFILNCVVSVVVLVSGYGCVLVMCSVVVSLLVGVFILLSSMLWCVLLVCRLLVIDFSLVVDVFCWMVSCLMVRWFIFSVSGSISELGGLFGGVGGVGCRIILILLVWRYVKCVCYGLCVMV